MSLYLIKKRFFIPFIAEANKQIHSTKFNISYILSMLIWPFLSLLVNIYTFYSFNWNAIGIFKNYSKEEMLLYIFTGGLAVNCFFSMNANSYQIVYEKIDNTINLIFQSPANRMSIIYGRTTGSFIQFTWIYIIYSLMIIKIGNFNTLYNYMYFLLIFIIMFLASVVWGGFCIVVFLISRESGFLFTFVNAPQEFLSGSLFPIQVLPKFLLIISNILPITYCILFSRQILIDKKYISSIHLYKFVILLIIIILITKVLIHFSEKNLRIKNSYNLY